MMNEPYLPKWATAAEAQAWLEFKTGQKWPLSRILETLTEVGFHLSPPAQTSPEIMRCVFRGNQGGAMVKLLPNDVALLAATRGTIQTQMFVSLDDQCFKVSGGAIEVALEEIRFTRKGLELISRRVYEGAKFDRPPTPVAFKLPTGQSVVVEDFPMELQGLPTSIEVMKFDPLNPAPANSEGNQDQRAAHQPLPKQRFSAQEEAILNTLIAEKLEPTMLPPVKAGKAGAKATIRKALEGKNPMFPPKSTVFNKAWERLSLDGRIAYKRE